MTTSCVHRLVAATAWFCVACGGAAAPEAALPAAPPPVPRVLTYQPFSASYRSDNHRTVEQEFNGQLTHTQVTMRYYLQADLSESDSGLVAALTIDSVPLLRGLPGVDPTGLAGTQFMAVLSPVGEVRDFQDAGDRNDLVRQIAQRIREFFPLLPPQESEPGFTWTDTVETNAGSGDLALLVQSINRHEVVGWSTWAGEQALHITTVSQYQVSGSGSDSGQEFTLEGTGLSHAHQYVAPNGRFLGRVSADTLHSTAHLPALGTAIPITQASNDTLTILP